MPSFKYEKSILFFLPLLVFLSLIFIVLYAFTTTAFVPAADNAPFVQDMRQEKSKKNAQNIVPLNQAHRTEKEMQALVTTMVSDSLSFNKNNFSDLMKKMKPLFTESGFQKYQQYLISSGIAEAVRINDYDVSLYVESFPLLINSSVINGRYKWLFEAPVTLTLFPKGNKEAIQKAGNYKNQTMMIRLQLTRVQIEEDTNAIQIEDWVVLRR